MKRIPARVLASFLVASLGLALLPQVRALAVSGAPGSSMTAAGYGAAGDMMGSGMMGGGMMGQPYGDQATPAGPANSDQAQALVNYIREQNLTCLQCHAISGGGFVPSFDTVSAQYANRPDAKAMLDNHIAHGFGQMPADLATEPQAARLAGLILNLNRSATGNPVPPRP